MSTFLEEAAAAQHALHRSAAWDQSVLLVLQSGTPKATIVHVDATGSTWVGVTRERPAVHRLRRAAQAVGAPDQHWQRSECHPLREQIVAHAAEYGRISDAELALFVIRDEIGGRSSSARWAAGMTTFIDEPLGHTDALLADAAAYATDPALHTGRNKAQLRLPPDMEGIRGRGPSALVRYLRLEVPELVRWIEPYDDQLTQQPASIQALIWPWVRIVATIDDAIVRSSDVAHLIDLLDHFAGHQEEYRPTASAPGRDRGSPGALIAGFVGGIWEDVQNWDDAGSVQLRLTGLVDAAAKAADSAGFTTLSSSVPARPGLSTSVPGAREPATDVLGGLAGLDTIAADLQRLWWLGKCARMDGIVLSTDLVRSFPADEMECVRLLCRMAANQPRLTTMASLHRRLPLQADRWMSLSQHAVQALDAFARPRDAAVADRLAAEIVATERGALDHAAVLKIAAFGIDRLTIVPRESAAPPEDVTVDALIEHRQGIFTVGTEVLTRKARHEPVHERHVSTFGPAQFADCTADQRLSLELVVLSAWRNIIDRGEPRATVRRVSGAASGGRHRPRCGLLPAPAPGQTSGHIQPRARPPRASVAGQRSLTTDRTGSNAGPLPIECPRQHSPRIESLG